MTPETVALTIILLSIAGGIVFARLSFQKKQRRLIRERLNLAFNESTLDKNSPGVLNIRKERGKSRLKLQEDGAQKEGLRLSGSSLIARFSEHIHLLSETAALNNGFERYKQATIVIAALPMVVALALGTDQNLDHSLLIAALAGLVLSSLPYLYLLIAANRMKEKFIQQLPEATDLIVSVLRTGHSIPRAVQTVAEEIPAPLGTEFQEIHQRLNLGQPLSEALSASAVKYDSHELDLIRRAVAIQTEVGGSLAELLDKTNSTLRQRLKLVRHIRVLTSQSRLTGIIVGALPILLALVLNYLKPGYLDPLFNKEMGRLLLILAVGLQIVGMLIMRKLSTMKV